MKGSSWQALHCAERSALYTVCLVLYCGNAGAVVPRPAQWAVLPTAGGHSQQTKQSCGVRRAGQQQAVLLL